MLKNRIGVCINLGILVAISGVLVWVIPTINAEIKNNADLKEKAAIAKLDAEHVTQPLIPRLARRRSRRRSRDWC